MKKFLDTGYLTIFSLFCAVIPFTDLGEAVPNIILGILIFLFFFVVKKKDWKKIQNKRFYALFLLVLLIIIQSILLSRWEDFKLISKLILLLGILIISIPINNRLVPVLSFITGSLILLALSSIRLVSYYQLFGKIDMTVGDHVATILFGDRPYIGYVYVLSFCLSLYFSKVFPKLKLIFYSFALSFLFALFIISARISLITIAIILLSYLFYTRNLKKDILIILALSFVSLMMFMFNPSLKRRFFISSNNYKVERLVKFEPRYFIWTCGYKTITNMKEFLSGQGFVNINKQLGLCYAERLDFEDNKQQEFFIRREFNSHSQPLNFLLSTGVLSLLLFILFFLFWFLKAYKSYFDFILLLSIVLFCLVENILSRQMGVELFALTLIFSNIISSKELN